MTNKVAIVIGATGATGRELVDLLLKDSVFSNVKIFIRRDIELNHPKLEKIIVDFDQMKSWKDKIQGDIVFSTLGTTLREAGSKETQFKIDHSYQYDFAVYAKENGIGHFSLLSSAGANPQSKFFYMKMKGELEEDVKKLNFSSLIIFRPGPLERPNTDRFGEKIMVGVIKSFNHIGLFKNQRPLPVRELAELILKKSKLAPLGLSVYEDINKENK